MPYEYASIYLERQGLSYMCVLTQTGQNRPIQADEQNNIKHYFWFQMPLPSRLGVHPHEIGGKGDCFHYFLLVITP